MAPSFFKRRRTWVVLSGLALAAIFFLREAFFVEPDSLVVKEYPLDLPGWPKELDGFRIAAVGDVHGGAPFIDEAKLKEVARRITTAKPDLIVWLGDYVIQGVIGGHFIEPERVAALLAVGRATQGHAAILGNHDRWLDPARVEKAFENAGIPFLRWSEKVLEVNGKRLHLYGLDDFELSPNYRPQLRGAMTAWSRIPPNEPLIVLSHSPDVFPEIPARVTLTLSAHTHGGQARFPLLGSLIVPSSFGQRFARGHIVETGRHLFVNTGIGTSIIPIRFGVPPEISMLTLHPSPSH